MSLISTAHEVEVFKKAEEMRKKIDSLKAEGKTIGYVPTMGYLHEGHKTLMREAKKENDVLVISIFVNPLQFGPGEDFDAYPRDFDRDLQAAKEEGVDFIFHPAVEEMYPAESSVLVQAVHRTNVLCGRSRPGHFDGVATVLTKLFNIIMPHRVYFGIKDAQQVAVVDGLIHDFNFPIELVTVATVREPDGLARSSRNVNLDPKERVQAKELYQSLLHAKALIHKGERVPGKMIDYIRSHIERTTDGLIDYIEIYSYPELEALQIIQGKVIIALAVKFSKTRLIDNIILEIDHGRNE